jgi:hypothetical protein
MQRYQLELDYDTICLVCRGPALRTKTEGNLVGVNDGLINKIREDFFTKRSTEEPQTIEPLRTLLLGRDSKIPMI